MRHCPEVLSGSNILSSYSVIWIPNLLTNDPEARVESSLMGTGMGALPAIEAEAEAA